MLPSGEAEGGTALYLGLLILVLAWIMLTIVGQVSIRSLTRMRRWDPFGLLPSWHFFAPNPARFDTVILERCRTPDRPSPEWRVAASFYDERPWHALVNPNRRIQKSMHDLQNAIGIMSDRFDAAAVCASAPAQALIRFVSRRSSDRGCPGTRQYAIARIENSRTAPDARVVFVTPDIATE